MFKSRLRKIKCVKVYESPKNFLMIIISYSQLKGIKQYCFVSEEYPKFEKIYDLLSM